MQKVFTTKLSFLLSFLICFFVTSFSYAEPAPLEVQQDGSVTVNKGMTANEDVTINKNLTVNQNTTLNEKLSVKQVLHLDPLSTPPANPSEGDMYLSSSKELLFFVNGKWMPIMFSFSTAKMESGDVLMANKDEEVVKGGPSAIY